MAAKVFDVGIIGGGIVGMATAMELAPRCRVVVLEAEDRLAAHQTGNNSGVIHSGLYYKPGSLKARHCVEGREALYRFCEKHDIRHERCGKVVVATSEEEAPRLAMLEERGRANGLEGIRRLAPEEIVEFEPHVRGLAALHVPQTGIVDYVAVTAAYADEMRSADGEIVVSARIRGVVRRGGEQVLETTAGEFTVRGLVNCAGLQCDRVARMCGVEPGVRIVPFRGEYREIREERRSLVANLIYPVPDPAFPFLGVHFTRRVDGSVEAGPNAVLAFEREGYAKTSFSLRDTLSTFTYPGFWKLALRYLPMGVGEFYRSFSSNAFVRALQRLVPEIREDDLRGYGAGVRAQALGPDGALLDDFHLVEAERQIHVLNAPSPAATASIAIGRTIAVRAAARFGLPGRSSH
jgi:L-2-hydroxyglutarate oxidase